MFSCSKNEYCHCYVDFYEGAYIFTTEEIVMKKEMEMVGNKMNALCKTEETLKQNGQIF